MLTVAYRAEDAAYKMTKRRLRIVHLIGSGYAASYWTVDALMKLKELGHDVIAVCPEDGTLAQRFKEKGIEAYAVSFPMRLINLIKCIYTINELRKLFIALKPDVINYQVTQAVYLGRAAAWLARVPVRISQWTGPAALQRKPYYYILELLTTWIDGAIIATSTGITKIYAKYPFAYIRKKVRLIYYGCSSERFNPGIDGLPLRERFGASDKDFVVAMVAYFYLPAKGLYSGGNNKGHEVLLRAASEIVKQDAHIKFWIVGDSLTEDDRWYSDYLKEYAHKLNLDGNCVFTGLRKDIPEILAASDIAVVPSFFENCGGAIEPLLMEKPVVASNVGGLPDVVIDGVTGILVAPGDPEALAEAILKLSRFSPERRREMGKSGRKIVMELFDMDKVARQTEELYLKLLSQHEAG